MVKYQNFSKYYAHDCGCLSEQIPAWQIITPDQELLQTVHGIKQEFEENLLQAGCSGFEISKNHPLIQEEVNKVPKKGVAAECEHEVHFLEGKEKWNAKTHPYLKILRKYF